ncbi:acetate kinase [Wohlfahrtiimonas chitiniclastica]|uniref:acetate kinase n=1 Tax=Wohlfahrtiimonas chitiniclastica TaxID=400946 RepID=UPI001BCC2671|nr:acetate kinase [Wohlfahrtiimonas chitiniclastica]MBS7827601.1 acetate kinase [Wohlfahrtiimonas chitiniclastica]
MSYILIFNCGSSSLKFSLMDADSEKVELSGLAERLGGNGAEITTKYHGDKIVASLGNGSGHQEAVEYILAFLKEKGYLEQIQAIGHRVVHGGNKFKSSALIDQEVLDQIEACVPLAPLHNPANLIGIKTAQVAFPHLPQVAVFDTAFHQTMPETAYLYAIPMELYRDHNVRRYGFHGTSHRFIAEKTIDTLGLDPNDHCIISAHLGNGSSLASIKNGQSMDTTMGFTPLEGLVMGTRSGDVDPGIVKYLSTILNIDSYEIDHILNTKSGLLGVSELSNDCRTLWAAAKEGHHGAQVALEMMNYRLAKKIVSYIVPLGRLDALVFTGGIGQNDFMSRKKVIEHLGFLGYHLDEPANEATVGGAEGVIATSETFGQALVLCTDEELMIVRDTLDVIACL